jgi:hypothetical protein
MKCLAQAVAEKSRRQDCQGQGGKVKGRRNVTLAHPLMKMSLYTNMKCLSQAVAEKTRGQYFQGQGHCGKVKGQSATKCDISTHPHENECLPNMKCLAKAVAEKLRGQDFQGQGHCGKVKGQSATKCDISTRTSS